MKDCCDPKKNNKSAEMMREKNSVANKKISEKTSENSSNKTKSKSKTKSDSIIVKDASNLASIVLEEEQKELKKVQSVLSEFKDFILKGNPIQLAAGVVLGSAFTNFVNTVVNALVNPIIAAIFGRSTISDTLNLTINGSTIRFGEVLGAITNVFIVSISVYFFIILPINKLNKMSESDDEDNQELITLKDIDAQMKKQMKDMIKKNSAS
ncbi:MAG: MscL family protein [Bifidobacteriaceae bacterium]|jgi:large conductance mechanosensitive channel|nr:MscL family protein [Bifidobacteriaceae bacterium]